MATPSVAETGVRIERPRQDDVMASLAALDACLEALCPPTSNHLLSIEELCTQNVRFFVACRDPAARGGLAWIRLETGIHQAQAQILYRAFGYAVCGPFGQYCADPLSVFMEKRLQ